MPPQDELDRKRPEPIRRSATTERLLRAVSDFAKAHPEFDARFVYSVRKQFAARGELSPRQIMALCNIVAAWRIQTREQ